ncbi:MAG: relaxase/mobilization nuclease domain-containing protein [Myxococcales bacterium]|nr:relaxase/mobilization nuclease domain-containing protein [Myxococcales bacterium]
MISKEVKFVSAGPGCYGRLVQYLLDPQAKEHRVGKVRLTNFHSLDVWSAIPEAHNVQQANTRVKNPTYHLVFAFHPGEHVEPGVLQAIEQRLVDALGFQEHQRISVVHHDREYLHVHVAISRVHPVTFKAHSPSWSYLTRDRVCAELECEFGLRPTRHRIDGKQAELAANKALAQWIGQTCGTELERATGWDELTAVAQSHGISVCRSARGLVFIDEEGARASAGAVSTRLRKKALERRMGPMDQVRSGQGLPWAPAPLRDDNPDRLPPGAESMERLSGRESLVTWVRRSCSRQLRGAVAWQQLHDVAREHGLVLVRRANGLSIVAADRGIAVKASSVSRDLSLAALQDRLGAYRDDRQAVERSERQLRRVAESVPEGRSDTARLSDREQLAAWVQKTCAGQLREARNWPQLHQAARAHGLAVVRRGNGLSIVVVGSDDRVKASAISRDLSLKSLEARLGPYQPGETPHGQSYQRQPMARPDADALYQRYLEDRRGKVRSRFDALQALRHKRKRDLEWLRRGAQLRWTTARVLSTGPVTRMVWRADARRRNARAFRQFIKRGRSARRRIERAHAPRGWVPWLQSQAMQGDAAALAALRARAGGRSRPVGQAIWGFASFIVAVKRIDSVTPTGTLLYSVEGHRVEDDGRVLRVRRLETDRAAVAVLRLAQERFGRRLVLSGGEAFRARLIRVAKSERMDVTFEDPQPDSHTEGFKHNAKPTRQRDRRPGAGPGRTERTGAGSDDRSSFHFEPDLAGAHQAQRPGPRDHLRDLSTVRLDGDRVRRDELLPLDAPRHIHWAPSDEARPLRWAVDGQEHRLIQHSLAVPVRPVAPAILPPHPAGAAMAAAKRLAERLAAADGRGVGGTTKARADAERGNRAERQRP